MQEDAVIDRRASSHTSTPHSRTPSSSSSPPPQTITSIKPTHPQSGAAPAVTTGENSRHFSHHRLDDAKEVARRPHHRLNPTARTVPLPVRSKGQPSPASESGSGSRIAESATPRQDVEGVVHGARHLWRSRDNRKGRHAVAVSEETLKSTAAPRPSREWRQVIRGLARMVMRAPVWDVSYDVAVVFTLGSVVWVVNSFFVFLPLVRPASEFPNESTTGGGVTAFVGATIFEIGSVLLMLEAVNESRSDCFGWALESALGEAEKDAAVVLRREPCRGHHHAHRGAWLRRPGGRRAASTGSRGDHVDSDQEGEGGKKQRRWSWWPSRHELRTHYVKEIGFLACSSQMIGATIFWISGFTALPPMQNAMSTTALNVVYWLPQVIGGSGFIISGFLFMVETQQVWWKPAPNVLGWHVGFWNLVGAVGFTLCGALGFASEQSSVEYASTLATFVGSWCFLMGSVVQWYESLDKYPIKVQKNGGGPTE